MKKGYKIVKEGDADDVYLSVFTMPILKPVTYSPQVWTERGPHNGPFGVFDTHENAIEFGRLQLLGLGDAVLAVFSVDYEPSLEKVLWFEIQKLRDVERYTYHLSICPTGTVLADKVKLVDRVLTLREDEYCNDHQTAARLQGSS